MGNNCTTAMCSRAHSSMLRMIPARCPLPKTASPSGQLTPTFMVRQPSQASLCPFKTFLTTYVGLVRQMGAGRRSV